MYLKAVFLGVVLAAGPAPSAPQNDQPLTDAQGRVVFEGRRIILDSDSYPREFGRVVEGPTVNRRGDQWVIAFQIDKFDDVLVRVLDARGDVVRTLGCGVLGENAPAPFQKNTLRQTLVWDGHDADGKPAPANCRIEVSVGLPDEESKEFDALLRKSSAILDRTEGSSLDELRGLRGRLEEARTKLQNVATLTGDGQSEYAVVVVKGLDKVRRNHVFAQPESKTVDLSACRGEYEVGQVVIVPFWNDLKGVKVTWGDLTDDRSGAKITSENLSCEIVAYVPSAPIRDDAYHYNKDKSWKARRIKDANAARLEGEWPDPLLPLATVDLEQDKIQPLWLTVRVPRDTSAGKYAGRLIVEPENAPSVAIPVVLRVRDFSLPERPPLQFDSSMNFLWSAPRLGFRFRTDEQKSLRFVRAYARELRRHHVRTFGVSLSIDTRMDEDGKLLLDFGFFDRVMNVLIREGMDTFRLNQQYLSMAAERPFFDRRTGKWIKIRWEDYWPEYARQLSEHLQKRGWMNRFVIMVGSDEPDLSKADMLERYQRHAAVFRDAGFTKYGGCVNHRASEHKEKLVGYINLWKLGAISPGARGRGPVDPDGFWAERKKNGDSVAWYVCGGPREPNRFITSPLYQTRTLVYETWRARFDGLTFYGFNLWHKVHGDDLSGRLQNDSLANPLEVGGLMTSECPDASDGDHFLVYPGPDIDHPIIDSIRFATLREAIGVSKQEALARTVRLIKAVVNAHDRTGWKYPWQSAFWAAFVCHGGWMLWDDLDAETQAKVAAIVEFEADRFIAPDYRVPYWNGRGGDTKAEENAWNTTILQLACAMMPGHPHVRQWKEVCSELMVSAYAMERDVQSETVVDGRPVKDWLHGYNARDDATVVNHGFMHPDYMTCIAFNVRSYLVQSLAGQPVPEAADFRAPSVYGALNTRKWSSPPYKEPGGTIYIPGRAEVYYPQRTDWFEGRIAIFYRMDVCAHVLGWDKDLPHPASYWMRLRADKMLKQQLRHPDGRRYAADEFRRFPGREQMFFQILANAFMLQWLDAHGTIREEN